MSFEPARIHSSLEICIGNFAASSRAQPNGSLSFMARAFSDKAQTQTQAQIDGPNNRTGPLARRGHEYRAGARRSQALARSRAPSGLTCARGLTPPGETSQVAARSHLFGERQHNK